MAQTKCKMQVLIDNMERVIEEFKIEFGIDSVITHKQYNYQNFFYHGIQIGSYWRDGVSIGKKIYFREDNGTIYVWPSTEHKPKKNYEAFKREVYNSLKKIMPLVDDALIQQKKWTVQQMEKNANDDFS